MFDSESIGAILDAQAAAFEDAPFLTFPGSPELSYGNFNRLVNQFANGLRDHHGVEKGDPVALMMGNRVEFCIASYALKKLGAIEVAVNTDFRGPGLVHTLNLTGTTVAIVDPISFDAVASISDSLPALKRIVLTDRVNASQASNAFHIADFNASFSDKETSPNVNVAATDTAAVLFTSGTTGPSKGCVLSHRYAIQMANTFIEACEVTNEDCLYCPFPLYHIDAAYLTLLPAVIAGCRAVISQRFSASRFWDEIRSTQSTIFDFMGATLTILSKQQPRSDDADNPVRLAWGVPMPNDSARHAFEERFGLRLVHNYGSTDGGVPCWESLDNSEPEGSCGIPKYPFEVMIVDDSDRILPAGNVGEIVIKPLEVDVTMKGYWGMPEETAKVFKNGWLHTGDLGRMDEDNHLFFLSRRKDVIRRRGQNISAWEVEQVVLLNENVVECVALAEPSELSEDEVKVVVVLRDGATLSLEKLQEFCKGRMASYMIPQFLQVVDLIPKTDTGKAQRYKLQNSAQEMHK